MAVACSMTEAVLPHMVSKVLPGVDVLFIDTGYHFAETIATRDEVARRLPLTVVDVTPRRTVPEQDAEFGDRMHSWDPVQCCEMRKVAPLKQALTRYEAWATGLRREDAPTRRETTDRPLGRQERPGEGEPAGGLDPAGPRGVRVRTTTCR